MNKATIKALQKSIKHWQENLAKAEAGTLINDDIMSNKCALCTRFCVTAICKRTPFIGKVEKCPVATATGRTVCKGSPWEDVKHAILLGFDSDILKHTQCELEFLESLLPEGA